MAEKYFLQTDFSGGISQSRSNGYANELSNACGVDIFSIPGLAKTSQNLTKESGGTVQQFCKFAINTSNGYSLWFGIGGDVYQRKFVDANIGNTPKSQWGSVFTNPAGTATLGAIEYNGYIYWATAQKLYRILTSSAINFQAWSLLTDVESWGSLTSADYHPMIPFYEDIFIGNGTTLASINSTGTLVTNGNLTTAFTSIPSAYQITCISRYGVDILAGTKVVGTEPSAKVYRYDGFTPSPTQEIDVPETAVHSILVTNTEAFANCGYNGKIYQFDGERFIKVKSVTLCEGKSNTDVKSFPQAVANYSGIGYFGISGGYFPGVYGLGRPRREDNLAFVNQYLPSDLSSASGCSIGAVLSTGSDLMVSWSTAGGTSGVGVSSLNINLSQTYYCGSSFIETLPINGNCATQKQFMNYVVNYQPVGATTTGAKLKYYINDRNLNSIEAGLSTYVGGTITLREHDTYNKLVGQQAIEGRNIILRYEMPGSADRTNPAIIHGIYCDWNEREVL